MNLYLVTRASLTGDQSADVWHLPSTTVSLIGTSAFDMTPGVIHDSYNAG